MPHEELLAKLYKAARAILPEIAEEELGSAIAAPYEEAVSIVKAKGHRWEELRAILAEVENAALSY